VLVCPEESDRPVVDFLRSTPGRMAMLAVVLIAALIAVGMATSKTVSDRQDRLEALRSHTEPLADAAQRIYGALSFANTTAATGFLSGGVQPLDIRARYEAAIGQASAGLVTASNGVSPNDVHSLRLLTDVSNQLAVYTEMIATARTNNRAGNPIGIAYLGGSSALMQQSILPSAEQLYRTQADAVQASGSSAGLWRAALAGVVPVLVLLALAQVFVARRSHRRLNPGLMTASVLMTVLAVWLVVAGVLSAGAVADARTQGGQPLDTTVTARIVAQEARADEILGLLKRGTDTQSDSNFDKRTAQLAQLIDGAGITGAARALDGWVRAQGEIRGKLAVGDYAGAVGIARDDGPQHSTPEFTRLDTALGDEITRLRDTQRQSFLRAATVMNLLPLGATVIGVSAALAVAVGFGPRLSEYH